MFEALGEPPDTALSRACPPCCQLSRPSHLPASWADQHWPLSGPEPLDDRGLAAPTRPIEAWQALTGRASEACPACPTGSRWVDCGSAPRLALADGGPDFPRAGGAKPRRYDLPVISQLEKTHHLIPVEVRGRARHCANGRGGDGARPDQAPRCTSPSRPPASAKPTSSSVPTTPPGLPQATL